MKHIILLSGKARHGKDTFAHLLNDFVKTQRVGFADLLKCNAIKQGWSGKKDDAGRLFLQQYGALGREKDPDIWIKKALRCIRKNCFYPIDEQERTKIIMSGQDPAEIPEEARVITITDCRFPNEIEVVKNWGEKRGYNVHTIRINRLKYDNGLSTQAQADPSETMLDDYPFDFKFLNISGDMGCLQSQIGFLVSHLGLEQKEKSFGIYKADEADGIVKNIQGKQVLTLDFDDTLLEKTGDLNYNILWQKIMSIKNVMPIIVTSRKENPGKEIFLLCKKLGITPHSVIYDAGKKDILKKIKPIAHFDDDIEVGKMCTEAGIPSFITGAFASPEYIKKWGQSIVDKGEMDYYTRTLGLPAEEIMRQKQLIRANEKTDHTLPIGYPVR